MTTLQVKRAMKHTAGLASVALHRLTPATAAGSACVFTYHRVTDDRVRDRHLDDWNVTPATLEQQVSALARRAEFLFAHELPERLAGGPAAQPLVCLTFDDGYQNFHDRVLPILERYRAKATVFPVTAFIGSRDPMPFDRWGTSHATQAPADAWRALDWSSLERCAQSGLVEVGGHSHWHRHAASLGPSDLAEEAEQSRDTLLTRLGPDHARSYAYPYGSSRLGQVPQGYVEAVRRAGYRLALATDLGLASNASDRYRLPRVEAYRSDSAAVICAKAAGALSPYLITDAFRRAAR